MTLYHVRRQCFFDRKKCFWFVDLLGDQEKDQQAKKENYEYLVRRVATIIISVQGLGATVQGRHLLEGGGNKLQVQVSQLDYWSSR